MNREPAMTIDISELEALNQLTWSMICARPDKVTGCQIAMPVKIDGEREDAESRFSDDFAVLEHIDAALALSAQGPLAAIGGGFTRVMHPLRWSQNPNYTEPNRKPSFLDGYAYAGFAGPDAPLLCAAPRGGLVLLGPGV